MAAATKDTDKSSLAAAESKRQEGNELYRNAAYDRAIDLYSEAIGLAPLVDAAPFYANRAAARLMIKQHKQALDDSLQAIKLDPKLTKAYERASKCQLLLGEFKEARELLERAATLPAPLPTSPSATPTPSSRSSISMPSPNSYEKEIKEIGALESKIIRSKELLRDKNYVNALPLLKQALNELSDEATNIRVLLAEALIGAKRYDEARLICNDLYKDHSESIPVLFWRGKSLYLTGNHTPALKHFQEILRMDPDNADAGSMLKLIRKVEQKKQDGNNAFTSGRNQEAYDAYSDALTLDPSNDQFNSTLYCNRAAAGLRLKRWDNVVVDCDAAIRLKSDSVKAYLRRGQAYLELERFDEAIRDYEKAQKLEPDNADIARQVKQAKLEQKKSKRKDYYKILGVAKDATVEQIKKAYKKAALIYHPDKNTESEEKRKNAETKFKDITEAYGVLSDEKLKRKYDSGEDLDDDRDIGSEVDVNQIFRMFFGGGRGGPGGGHGGHAHMGGGGFF